MLSQEMRRGFLKYFKERGHALIASSSVVPHDDPTLLFNNAGMNQFKDVFLGKSQREYSRATTSQKCIRVGGKHNDLDNVGHTSRHLTFFEMLGNFSFGDYFKEQAILFAWEVSTQIFQFDPEKIWITIFETDEEAFALWKKIVPEKRIVRMGEKDNFWAMGDTGPCGPCSELYFDRGPAYGNATSLKEDIDGNRYLEFWNLVFMQFNRDAAGHCQNLPKQSIDTGAGLERVVALKMGVDNVFATDILRHIITQIEQVSGQNYNPKDPHLSPAFHVIADHLRSLSFAIADGAQPSNIERGYVLRKLLRRAVRYGRMLGLQEPFLARVLPSLIEGMGSDYRELSTSKHRIAEILTLEEEAFLRTLKRGGNILNQIIEKAHTTPSKQITGEEAFKLKDTYGFPLEEILLIAKDTGLQINLEAYQMLEEKAKETSRAAQTAHHQMLEQNLFEVHLAQKGASEFLGYETLAAEGAVTAIVVDGQFVESLQEGQQGMIILDRTPFYAEMGGQIGDQGTLAHDQAKFAVAECHLPFPGVIVHVGYLSQGTLLLGEPVVATVESARRQLIANNHTATHLLHWALQEVLGTHIRQAGSLVDPNKLRFDFNHHKALSSKELRQIETLVNDKVRENRSIEVYELPYEEVQGRADIKQFFGEKYGTQVRVIDIDYSKELCGGTHTHHTGTIGMFKILKESSIAAGVRRIEAVTGKAAEEWAYQLEDLLDALAQPLKVPVAKLKERIHSLLEEHQQLSLECKQHQQKLIKQMADTLSAQKETLGEIPFVCAQVSIKPEWLSALADEVLQKNPSCVLILASHAEQKAQLLVRVSKDWTSKGIQAGALIKEIAPQIEGLGGGKADSAQAGGKKPEGIPKALEAAKQWLLKQRF